MKSKKVTRGLLIFYLIALTWVIIFKLQFPIENLPHIRNINLIPFTESVIINGKIDISELFLNTLAFVPFGLFIHILREQKSIPKQFIPIICTSLLYETTQFAFSIGATDITDLILNSLGGITGIIIAIALSKIARKNWIKTINIISLIGAATLTLFITIILLANT